MPKASGATGRIGVHLVGRLLESHGWFFREQTVNDFGIDAHAEAPGPHGNPSGRLLALQIKAGASWFKEGDSSHVVYRGEIRHRDYWRDHSLPVVIVLCDLETQTCLWQVVSPETILPTKHGWKLEIPRTQVLDSSALEIWSQLSQATEARGPGSADLAMQYAAAACNVALSKVGKKFRPELYVQRKPDAVAWELLRASGSTARATVLIERAGSGKTNLLCSMVRRLIDEGTLCVLLLGSDPLDDRFGLLAEVLGALGGDPGEARRATAVREQLLPALNGRPLCVLIDAVNEARDVEMMRASLLELFARLKDVPARLFVTCRDIYWSFLKGSWIETLPCDVISLDLYRFDPVAWPVVRDRYFDYFRVRGSLEGDAEEQCRHPLLLRFFCEAYENESVAVVTQIRLKPLFEKYLRKKMEGLTASADVLRPEEVLLDALQAIAAEMLHTRDASIPEQRIAALTKDEGFRRRDSIYVRLLDEDVLLEEVPDSRVAHLSRRVRFVYEAFFEFMLARQLEREWNATENQEILDRLDVLLEPGSSLRNVLGSLTYLEDFFERRRLPLWLELAKRAPVWQWMVLSALREADPENLPRQMCEAFPALLASGSHETRIAAIELLASDPVHRQLDPENEGLVFCLRSDPSKEVRAAAAAALQTRWKTLTASHRIALGKAALDPASQVRKYGREALQLFFGAEERAEIYEFLRDAAGSKRAAVRAAAVRAFDLRHYPQATEHLTKALDDVSPMVRKAAIRSIRTKDAIAANMHRLVALLEDSHPTVRWEAAIVLRRASDMPGSTLLKRRLESEASPIVLRRMMQAVSTGAPAEVQAAVVRLLDHPAPLVRRSATWTLLSTFGMTHAKAIFRAFIAHCGPLERWTLRWDELRRLVGPDKLGELLAGSFSNNQLEPEDTAFAAGLLLWWTTSRDPALPGRVAAALPELPAGLAATFVRGVRMGSFKLGRTLHKGDPLRSTLAGFLRSDHGDLAADAAQILAATGEPLEHDELLSILGHSTTKVRVSFAWGLSDAPIPLYERSRREVVGDEDDDIPF